MAKSKWISTKDNFPDPFKRVLIKSKLIDPPEIGYIEWNQEDKHETPVWFVLGRGYFDLHKINLWKEL
jgi:hypothetical protein